MRFAIQSIVFGKDVEDLIALKEMCTQIYDAGFRGVELFQDFMNPKYEGIDGVRAAMKQAGEGGISLVGVAGGTLEERIDFALRYSALEGLLPSDENAPYVYVDEWNEQCALALRAGVRIGLHPHMFRPIQTIKEANERLRQFESCSELQLLPDTAHLRIAGDDPVAVIKHHLPRIGAIHLKDWNPNAGRSYQFYASGFCQLGEGCVALYDCLRVLWMNEFKGWVVVEHDHSSTPADTINESMKWLRNSNNLPQYILQRDRMR